MTNIDKQALRERYSEKPAPTCHICGAVMTIQRASAGSVIYGCTGRIDGDGEGYKFEAGRNFADDHYARSRVTEYSPGGDHEVLTLLDELEAAGKRAGKRIAELEITRERLLKIQQWRETYGPGSNVVLPAEEAEELARIVLASLEAEPVAYMCKDGDHIEYNGHNEFSGGGKGVPLYAAPPVPVELTDEQIDAVLDSQANIAYVIASKRERLRMFAREILRTATPAPDHNYQKTS
ncbi:TPA: ead/Ea22-like family protein [Citrobacter braakii]